MKKFIKYLFLVFLGVIGAFIIAEVLMQIIKPPMLFDKAKHCNHDTSIFEKSAASSDFFKYLYVDIYDNYFELKNNTYVINRVNTLLPDSKRNEKFSKIKKTDNIRIFIAGESVAEQFPNEILRQTLKQENPETEFEIINAGTGAYESYRIKRVIKEILKHQPDYIVIMIGNNDGLYEPLEINYFPYKYKIFRTSYVLNRLSNWFVKRRYLNDEESLSLFFQKNILSIVKSAKNKSKLIFVTLPRNSFFVNTSFEYNFPEINYNPENDEIYDARRNFLKSLSQKYSWVHVADYNFMLKNKVSNYLGYNIFRDNVHYWTNMYWLISRLISDQISNKTSEINAEYIFSLMKKNDLKMQQQIIKNIINDDNVFESNNHFKAYYICEKLYNNDKEQFSYFIEEAFKNNKKFVICAGCHFLILSGNERQALRYLNVFLRKNPENYKGYLLKALAYYKSGDRQSSEKYFNIAKKLNPKNNFDLEYLDKFYKEKTV